MRIAYIHDDRKIYTGAHHINELIICKLREFGAYVKNFYPRTRLIDGTHHDLKGVSNILFFYSLWIRNIKMGSQYYNIVLYY